MRRFSRICSTLLRKRPHKSPKEKEQASQERADTPQTSISKAWTLEGIAAFWDTHSLDDYWDQTDEEVFTVRAQYRQYRSMNMLDLRQLKPQYVTNEAGEKTAII
jgi:hypothetical protein